MGELKHRFIEKVQVTLLTTPESPFEKQATNFDLIILNRTPTPLLLIISAVFKVKLKLYLKIYHFYSKDEFHTLFQLYAQISHYFLIIILDSKSIYMFCHFLN